MSSTLIRLAIGATLALALSGAASAADAVLHVKPTTPAATTGKCVVATMLFAKFTEGDAKEGDDKAMTEMAVTWLTFMQAQPEAYQNAAIEQLAATTATYKQATDKSAEEAFGAITVDAATCILEME